MRRSAATILLFAGALVLAVALAIVLTGGMAFQAVPLTLRNPIRPLAAGLALLLAAAIVAGRESRDVFATFAGRRETRAPRLAALVAACVLVFAIAWTSRSAGGSDSSCYVLQAEAFAHGHATLENPVARVLPGMPNAVFAPTGFVPSARDYGVAVPICAPGLALAMAGAYWVHPSMVFLVVPVTAALLVWLTFVYGRQMDGEVTGVCAALLVACSPIFLYQAVQPMSDVPAAAAWLAALVSVSPVAAGVWASIAVLIRPNLALLVVPLLVVHMLRDRKRLIPLLAAALPGGVVFFALNAARYGGGLASGYGDTDVLFSLDHVAQNLPRYARWISETQTPVVLLALAAPWVLRRDAARARLAGLSLMASALLVATYLAYTVFDDWWYTRFLLPALPVMVVLTIVVGRACLAVLPAAARGFALGVLVVTLSAYYLHVAHDRHVAELQWLESRFARAGELAARRLPHEAVTLAVQQSGSIRFHGRRDTIAWDAIPSGALDATVETLQHLGRPVYIALEAAEEPAFRLRFAGQRIGALDWRPMADVAGPARPRFYDIPVR